MDRSADNRNDTSDESGVAVKPDRGRGFGLRPLLARFEPAPALWTTTHSGIDHRVLVTPVPGKPWKVNFEWFVDGTSIGVALVSPFSPDSREPRSHPQRRPWLRPVDFSLPKNLDKRDKRAANQARSLVSSATLSYELGATYWHVLDLDYTPPKKGPHSDPALYKVGVQMQPPADTLAAKKLARTEKSPTLMAFVPLLFAAVRIALMFLPALVIGLGLSVALPHIIFPSVDLPSIDAPNIDVPSIPWPSVPWPPSWWPEWSLPIPEWLRRVVSFVMDNLRIILIAVGAIMLSRRYLRRNHARKKRLEQSTRHLPSSSGPDVDLSMSRQETLTCLATALNNHKNQLKK